MLFRSKIKYSDGVNKWYARHFSEFNGELQLVSWVKELFKNYPRQCDWQEGFLMFYSPSRLLAPYLKMFSCWAHFYGSKIN